jgi:pantothenate kinase
MLWMRALIVTSLMSSQDGFHYTQKMLSTFEDAGNAFRRRGAPFTFDAGAFIQLVHTLKDTPATTSSEPEILVNAPSFDHAAKDPVENAISISSRSRIVIVEGNYTLLNQSPWSDIAGIWAEKYVVGRHFERSS